MEVGLTFGAGDPTASATPAVGRQLEDDASLVRAIARGDAHALEAVYDRYGRGVYSLALRLLSDSPSAEEVVQETFLKLWRQPGAYQSNRGRLLAWLLGVAHHHAVDLLRRRQLEQRHGLQMAAHANGDGVADLLETRGLVSTEADPQSRAGNFDQRLAVSSALAALPTEQRVPIELAYYQGMTQVEIASALGLPLGTIKTRMRLGMQQLRKVPELAQVWSDR